MDPQNQPNPIKTDDITANNYNKIFYIINGFLIILIIIFAGYFLLYLNSRQKQTQLPANQPNNQSEVTADWQDYDDESLSVSFSYPENFSVLNNTDADFPDNSLLITGPKSDFKIRLITLEKNKISLTQPIQFASGKFSVAGENTPSVGLDNTNVPEMYKNITNKRSITLAIYGITGEQMMISENASFSGASWQPI